LPDVLIPIETWKWPRSDLHWWIKVLNKFDAVLEEIIRDYDVDKLQVNEFTPLTKKTLCSILAFERLLLENSTNRKLFNSYDVRTPHFATHSKLTIFYRDSAVCSSRQISTSSSQICSSFYVLLSNIQLKRQCLMH